MKTLTLLSILFFSNSSTFSQVNTELRIYHFLGNQSFQLNTTTQNNLANDFQVTRVEFYVTNFSVMHDGGQETAISSDTVALINAANGIFSTVELGNLAITNVEAVKFYIGVPQPANNADPSLYGPDHPLAPKSPSMHWGWASGYRFLAYEGQGGMNFSQTFQLHALGNSNYFQTTVAATGQLVNGSLVIALDADYTRGLEDINVSNGVIAHGVDLQDLTALENFRDFVFSSSTQNLTAGTDDFTVGNWNVYPNPLINSTLTVQFSDLERADAVRVSNALGQEIAHEALANGSATIDLVEAGVYFVTLMKDGIGIASKRIVKQ